MTTNIDPKPITIGTWNVRYAPEVFGDIDKEYEWESRRHELAKIVKDSNLDILAVQECNRWQLEQIAEVVHLEMELRADWADCFYPTFFFNSKRVKINDQGDLWLSKTPSIPNTKLKESTWPRMLTWIYADIKAVEGPSLLINVHMDGENEAQMEIFNDLLSRLVVDKEPVNIFISGDFNLSQKRFLSKSSEFYKGFVHHTFANTWNGHGKIKRQLDIDWILISANIQKNYEVVFRRKEAKIEKDSSVFYVSDHDLVLAKISIKGT